MSFEDIKGQDNAIDFIKNSVKNNKISHAYIFSGPTGVGRKMAALNFAKALNCLDLKDGEPCGACIPCRKIDASNHPDVFIFSPEKEGSGIGIDKIRSIIKDIGLKAYEGRKKVYIIDGADSITRQGANALLKTLEEPPSDSVLILIAENASALLPTIQSRAERVRFFPLAAEDISGILIRGYKLDKDKADLLSRISAGSAGKAIKYSDSGFFEKRGRIISSLEKKESIMDMDFDTFSKPDMNLALEVMLAWYRDILIMKFGGGKDKKSLVNADRFESINAAAAGLSFEDLNNIINRIILTGSFIDGNVNPKLAMGALLCTKSFR